MRTTNIIQKIENILTDNKSGLKTYKTYEAAVKTAIKEIDFYADTLTDRIPQKENVINFMEYIVVYIPSTQRFTPIFNHTRFRDSGKYLGGYIGHFAVRGFMQI